MNPKLFRIVISILIGVLTRQVIALISVWLRIKLASLIWQSLRLIEPGDIAGQNPLLLPHSLLLWLWKNTHDCMSVCKMTELFRKRFIFNVRDYSLQQHATIWLRGPRCSLEIIIITISKHTTTVINESMPMLLHLFAHTVKKALLSASEEKPLR